MDKVPPARPSTKNYTNPIIKQSSSSTATKNRRSLIATQLSGPTDNNMNHQSMSSKNDDDKTIQKIKIMIYQATMPNKSWSFMGRTESLDGFLTVCGNIMGDGDDIGFGFWLGAKARARGMMRARARGMMRAIHNFKARRIEEKSAQRCLIPNAFAAVPC